MVGPIEGSEGRHVDRWLSSSARWIADVSRDITVGFCYFPLLPK